MKSAYDTMCEADAWYQLLSRMGRPLFAEELRPGRTLYEIYDEYPTDLCHRSEDLWTDIADAVSEVIAKRQNALKSVDAPIGHVDGRVLLYDPKGSTFDGLARGSNLFDEVDAPVWDLWIDVVRLPVHDDDGFFSSVVAWIPRELVEEVEYVRAHLVPHGLAWADDPTLAGSPVAALLRERGVVGAR